MSSACTMYSTLSGPASLSPVNAVNINEHVKQGGQDSATTSVSLLTNTQGTDIGIPHLHQQACRNTSCFTCQRTLEQAQKALTVVQALVSSRLALATSPLCLPYPQNHESNPFIYDHLCTIFSPNQVKELWNASPSFVIDASNIHHTSLEQVICGALQRITLETGPESSLHRGDIIEINHSNLQRRDDYKFIVSNTQYMDDWSALIRIVTYHMSGLRVEPYHIDFGTRILVIPRSLCDVVFPPALNQFALQVTAADADLHPQIRQSALGQLEFFST